MRGYWLFWNLTSNVPLVLLNCLNRKQPTHIPFNYTQFKISNILGTEKSPREQDSTTVFGSLTSCNMEILNLEWVAIIGPAIKSSKLSEAGIQVLEVSWVSKCVTFVYSLWSVGQMCQWVWIQLTTSFIKFFIVFWSSLVMLHNTVLCCNDSDKCLGTLLRLVRM